MEEKYTIKIQSENGDIEITGPSLHEISEVAWIRDYLGLSDSSSNGQSVQLQQQSDERIDKLEQTTEQVRRAVNYLIEKENQKQEQQQKKPAAPQPQQQMPASAPAPQQQKQEPEFLSISPEQMTTDVWESLSDEQRSAWKQKYGI